jgi:hypothetical protein
VHFWGAVARISSCQLYSACILSLCHAAPSGRHEQTRASDAAAALHSLGTLHTQQQLRPGSLLPCGSIPAKLLFDTLLPRPGQLPPGENTRARTELHARALSHHSLGWQRACGAPLWRVWMVYQGHLFTIGCLDGAVWERCQSAHSRVLPAPLLSLTSAVVCCAWCVVVRLACTLLACVSEAPSGRF